MKLTSILILCAIPFVVIAISPAEDQKEPVHACDYDSFLDLAKRMQSHRDKHLVNADKFMAMALEPGTVILDARSETHFEAVRIAGSVNLPYTSFSGQALRELIPDRSTRILIYCRNNLIDSSKPSDGDALDIPYRKGVNVGLNIPTAITLYAYGYENVWELTSIIDISKPKMKLAGRLAE